MKSSVVRVPFVDLSFQHQPIKDDITQVLQSVVKRGDFVLGQALAEFETAFAKACNVKYAVGVASGTSAIAIGLQACGIGKGDEVIVPANTFIASVIGIIQAGATPILVDCELDTALIDLTAAAKLVTPKTKAILPVHLYGQMVSPQALLDFAQTHNLIIFEDSAQAHLATKEGYYAGSVGKAAAFSFYPSKNLGALGNGGMIVTDDEAVAKKARSLRNYGASQKYLHVELGTNSRLDTLQAAILHLKLPYLPDWNQMRNQAGEMYDRYFRKLAHPEIKPIQNYSDRGHVYHLYVVRLPDSLAERREQIQTALADAGIQSGIHYPIPCHLQPAFKYLGYQSGDFAHAETLSAQILSLPIFPGITKAQIELVCQQLLEAVNIIIKEGD
ncbi:Pleiotropic regulatory protein [Hyella patelloides LEGE 07179]|uniref:Pleiotropic regulatory protein n=1 Tax=Hyella patelloides LEGE 07179 TaxID=945734 RepID=A0A563W460_9CYAN|nr:DegT/DnrJ/EryC1/StrS family aminotransferase [Hyella patelloides]VEP18427.1 Pleiotropic regulatory protein [Hyella patelloides LEGE 07179]